MIKDVSLLLNAVGAGNCFLLSYTYLLKREPKRVRVSHILSLLFFVIGAAILNTILNFSGYSHLLYGFEPLSNALIFAIAPLLFLYVRSFKGSTDRISLWSAHLALFYVFLAVTLLSLAVPQGVLGLWAQRIIGSKWTIVFWNLHFISYLFGIGLEFRKMKKRPGLNALIIIWGTVSIWFFNLLFFLYRTWVEPLPILVYLNITLLFSLMTLYLFYRNFGTGERQKRKLSKRGQRNKRRWNKETDPIVLAIRQNEYYRNPDLDIRSLSEQLQLPYHELSNWINQNYQQNFNAFINSFRVQEVVNGLENQQHQAYTIMGLAEKAGFKSASSFYAAFKKEKGITPSEYLKHTA